MYRGVGVGEIPLTRACTESELATESEKLPTQLAQPSGKVQRRGKYVDIKIEWVCLDSYSTPCPSVGGEML